DTAQFPRGIFLERLRASDTEKSQQDVGHQRGAQAVERGTQAFVNLLGGGQQSTGHQRRNGQQNSSPRQVLCRSKQRLRVVESSQGGQQTIQGTVQRVRIEARSCWFGLGRFLKNCLWCLWGRNGSAGLSETAADGAGGSALGKRGSVASGAGRQPNR